MTRTLQAIAAILLAFPFVTSFNPANAACTCKKIGGGFCIPDLSCAADSAREKSASDIGNTLKKAAAEVGSTVEKGNYDNSKTIDWVSHDLGGIFTKSLNDTSASISKLRILETGYSQLEELGKEEAGYGLYSYAVITANSPRSAALLSEIFKSIPAIEDTAAQRSQLNIFYIPIKNGMGDAFANLVKTSGNDPSKMGADFAQYLYNLQMGRAILDHVCNPPLANDMKELCDGPMSAGPYILTYSKPASSLEPVPPPLLFVDLSNIREAAFPEYISAFRSQVKQADITDGSKIHSLRLTILNILITAAILVDPVRNAVADIVHDAGVVRDSPADKPKK